jgi:hypothetical protein
MPAQPAFRRFWVRILPDGSALPQFDPRTGKYCGFEEYLKPVAQVLFFPVTPRLAGLIRSQGDVAEASDLMPLTFDISPGTEIEFHRVGTVHLKPKMICGFCEAEFDISEKVCPRCLAKNQWYCGKCDELKEIPIVDFELLNAAGEKRIVHIPPALWDYVPDVIRQIPGRWYLRAAHERCPDCEKVDPRGVRRIQCVGEFCEEKLYTHYVLDFNGERHIIMDYKLRR